MPSVVGQITKGAVFDVLVDADSVGGDGGANTLPDDAVALSNITQHNATIAGAVLTDDVVVRGDGGARGVQTSTVTIDDNGVMSVVGLATGGRTDYDLVVGDPADYGVIRLGNAIIARTSYKVGAIDLDGAILIQNVGGPVTGEIEIIFAESTGSDTRLALPKSGVGNAMYSPRSMLIIGPAPADTDFVKVSYWQALGFFHNLLCDTSGFGADLGVEHDLEVENIIYVDDILESTTDAGVTIDGVLVKDGNVDGRDVGVDGTTLDDHVGDSTDPHGASMSLSTSVVTPELASAGNIAIKAISAAGHTIVSVANPDATYDADLDVERNITVGGTVDGRDVAADGTLIDAHVADTTDPHGADMTVSVILRTPHVLNAGNLILDAFSASGDTEVQVSNADGTYKANLNVEGDILVGGTVDGRDVDADGTILDGLETLALAYAVAL